MHKYVALHDVDYSFAFAIPKKMCREKFKRRSSMNIKPCNVGILLYIAFLSTASLYVTHAKLFATPGLSVESVDNVLGNAPQQALNFPSGIRTQYDDENSDVDSTIQTPWRRSGSSVSTL